MKEERRVRDCQPMTRVARRLRRDSTPAEARMWEVLRDRRCGGYRFLRQHDIGHYVVDFYCAAVRLAIEVDGGIHTVPTVRENDRGREAILREEKQITFLRFSNDQILQTPLETLREQIAASLTPGYPLGARG